jgi:hypothetical protein
MLTGTRCARQAWANKPETIALLVSHGGGLNAIDRQVPFAS